jgi:UDP-2,3-diacylglucosamine pyrophosphatase LpxH
LADRAQAIAKGLDAAYEAAGVHDVDLADARLVIFSDHHRGARDAADDFRRCERAYCAALAHYLEAGFTLFAVGDVEELWECTPEEALAAYPDVLGLEAEFHAGGRLHRFFGNHDDHWRDQRQVAKHLHPAFPGLEVREALRLRLLRSGEEAGEIVLAHGHQGTLDSGPFAWLSRLVLRYIWRPLQRRVGFGSVTPAADWELRREHDAAMFAWARQHPARPILITGHTHRPVFASSRPPVPRRRAEAAVAEDLEEARRLGQASAVAELRSELELIRAEARRGDPPPLPVQPPCYFNAGACSFADGDVTGLEIAEGKIRLVRWLDDSDDPHPKLLVEDPIDDILGQVRAAGAQLPAE